MRQVLKDGAVLTGVAALVGYALGAPLEAALGAGLATALVAAVTCAARGRS